MNREEYDNFYHLCGSCKHQMNISVVEGIGKLKEDIFTQYTKSKCLLFDFPLSCGKVFKCDKHENKS